MSSTEGPAGRFADRLDPATFAADPVVGVYERGPDDGDAVWVPERLFARLVAVGAGYELHTLPMLGGSEPMRLGRVRCAALVDEVEFVAERLDDALVHEVARALCDYLARRIWDPLWDATVTIEGV